MTSPVAGVAAARARDRLLFALTVSSGAIDAISFLALGRVFTAFMTGNIVFLGLSISGAPAPSADLLVASMAGFAVGVFLATRIIVTGSDATTRLPRVPLALALSLIGHFAFIALWIACDARPGRSVTGLLIACWAVAMGMQSGAVRALRVESMFTTAATASLIGLVADLVNVRGSGAEIRRLGLLLFSLAAGATAGGSLLRSRPLAAPFLPFVITAVVVLAARRQWTHAQVRARR